MTKREIREDVNKIIKEYPGDDHSHLLMIIKEHIENKLRDEKA